MKTGRHDYDALLKSRHIPEGEPTFLLRGRDVAAADAVQAYAVFARHAGASADLVESALQQADRMAAFSVKKVPDLEDMPEEARRHLAFVHERRVWDLGRGTPYKITLAIRPLSPTPAALLAQMANEHFEAVAQAQHRCNTLEASADELEAKGVASLAADIAARRRQAGQAQDAAHSLNVRAQALLLAADALAALGDDRSAA